MNDTLLSNIARPLAVGGSVQARSAIFSCSPRTVLFGQKVIVSVQLKGDVDGD